MATNVMSVEELMALPKMAAHERVRYGQHAAQFCDLYLPPEPRAAPAPVVVMVHGGCWRAMYDLDHASALCDALALTGRAVWSMEYRRVGDGGEWPGLFDDVALGADTLRDIAPKFKLDMGRVVVVGHSAGGHIALWLGARRRLPASCAWSREPLVVRGVVASAPVCDLAASLSDGICTGNAANLLGGSPREVAERYALASPSELLPLGVKQILLCGQHDDIVPLAHVERYAAAAKAKGDHVELRVVNDIGHFELVAPGSAAWASLLAAIDNAMA